MTLIREQVLKVAIFLVVSAVERDVVCSEQISQLRAFLLFALSQISYNHLRFVSLLKILLLLGFSHWERPVIT